MREINEIESFYEGYDEWNRLERHRIEFEITKRYLDKYIPKNSRVFDIGGGPGRYSIYLAQRGHRVTLLDISKKHIEIALEKAKENNVHLEDAIHGDALELKGYNLEKFDVILLMGPLYHLTGKGERDKVMEEALALLKPGGIIIASFISAYAPILDTLKHSPEEIDAENKLLNYLNNGVNTAEEGFTTAYFITPQEARDFMKSFGLNEYAFAGVEGFGAIAELRLNSLPQDKFQLWVDVIYKLAEDQNILGTSEHLLYVGGL